MKNEGLTPKLPFRKDEVKDYERTRYRGLDQKIVHWRENRILDKILERTGLNSGSVLDIPCGYGRFSEVFLEKGFSLSSSDLSLAMVRRALDRALQDKRRSILGVVADAVQGLPFKSGGFALVFSMRFFHHVHSADDREFILREFARVTSGWVVCSYYQLNVLHSIQRKLRKCLKRSPTRIKMISRKAFRREAAMAGLQVVKVFPLLRGIHAHHIALLKKTNNLI